MINGLLKIDLEQWDPDESTYFKFGIGYWALNANAFWEMPVGFTYPGKAKFEIRVRTGTKTVATDKVKAVDNPTDYVSSYSLSLDGINIPLTLDQARPPEARGEYGGSYIGWLIAEINVPDQNTHNLKFTTSKQYGAYDYFNIIQPMGVPIEKYNADVAAAKESGRAEGKKEQRDLDVKESQAKYEEMKVYSPLE